METPNPTSALKAHANLERTSQIQCRPGFEGLDVAGRAARAETLHRAHSIWLGNGCPENSALDDWLKAEAEVLRES